MISALKENGYSRAKGLTLIELLVAISVLAIIAILGWRGLDGIVRARIALTGDLEQTRGMQITFAQLQSDCAHLASSVTLSNRPSLTAEQGRLTLVRTVYADNQPSQLQVVSYRLNGGVLSRTESTATRDLMELDSLWQAAANGFDTTRAVVLQLDVTAVTMRFWINSGWATNFSAPTPTAVPTATTSTPTGLEVTLRLRGIDSGIKKIFLLGAV